MMTTIAYSRKYQFLEKERLRSIQDSIRDASKSARERAHFLSKQTSRRQKTLEQKKRAMVQAEEERRRKALEDRKKVQVEATQKFKSAINRLKSMPYSDEIFLPNKAVKVVGGGGGGGGGGGVVGRENIAQEITATVAVTGAKSEEKLRSERIAFGRQVEIHRGGGGGVGSRRGSAGLQRRSPSLDDVVKSIRGPTGHAVSKGQATPTQLPLSQPRALLGTRCASDPDLAAGGFSKKTTPAQGILPQPNNDAAGDKYCDRTAATGMHVHVGSGTTSHQKPSEVSVTRPLQDLHVPVPHTVAQAPAMQLSESPAALDDLVVAGLGGEATSKGVAAAADESEAVEQEGAIETGSSCFASQTNKSDARSDEGEESKVHQGSGDVEPHGILKLPARDAIVFEPVMTGVAIQRNAKCVRGTTSSHEREAKVVLSEFSDDGSSPTDSLSESYNSSVLQDSFSYSSKGSHVTAKLPPAPGGKGLHQKLSAPGTRRKKLPEAAPVSEGSGSGPGCARQGRSHHHRLRYSYRNHSTQPGASASAVDSGSDSESSSGGESRDFLMKRTPPRLRRHHIRQANSGKNNVADGSTGLGSADINGTEETVVEDIVSSAGSGSSHKPVSILKKKVPESYAPSPSSTLGPSQFPSELTESASSGTAKRVRFVDQVVDPNDGSTTTLLSSLVETANLEQWWKRVFSSNGHTHPSPSPPGDGFTPKMKVSFVSKPNNSSSTPKSGSSTPCSIGRVPNGIALHHAPNVARRNGSNSHGVPTAGGREGREEGNATGGGAKGQGVKKRSHFESPDDEGSRHHCEREVTSEEPATPQERSRSPSVALESTPTDDDIDSVWGEMVACFKDNRERMTSIPHHHHHHHKHPPGNQPPSSRGESGDQRVFVTLGGGGATRQPHLQHRVHGSGSGLATGSAQFSQQILRCQNPVQLWKHKRTTAGSSMHWQSSAKDPACSRRTKQKQEPPTALSLEEKRLLESLDRLNQRLRDNHPQAQGPMQNPALHTSSKPYLPGPPKQPGSRTHFRTHTCRGLS